MEDRPNTAKCCTVLSQILVVLAWILGVREMAQFEKGAADRSVKQAINYGTKCPLSIGEMLEIETV